jgi:hypothetical protein
VTVVPTATVVAFGAKRLLFTVMLLVVLPLGRGLPPAGGEPPFVVPALDGPVPPPPQ